MTDLHCRTKLMHVPLAIHITDRDWPDFFYHFVMKLTNDSYIILMGTKNFTERYYRDKDGWLKISARGRKFRMTAEQVLNHLLPAVAGIKPNLTVKVEHRDLVSPEKTKETTKRTAK